MKKFIAFILMVCVIAIAIAQSAPVEIEKKVVCDNTKRIVDVLINEYNESPIWAGNDEKSKYSILINQETGTWTIIQFDKNTTCILGTGENSRATSFGKLKNIL